MPYSYVSVTVLKGTGALNIDGTAYDTRLRQVIEAVSTEIDRHTFRTFQPQIATYHYAGDGSTLLRIHDLISIGTLLEDTNKDGTFETGWATTDYWLLPLNADPTGTAGAWIRPHTTIQVRDSSDGTQDEFLKGGRNYRVTGTWGYGAWLSTAAAKGSGSLGSTATAYPVSTVGIEPGMTILVDSEQMYVLSTATTTLTVTRAVNGATAGTHADTSGIQYYSYPAPIVEAVLIQASRLWKRRESGYANQIGIPETGQMMIWKGGLDPDVQKLIISYKRLAGVPV